MGYSDDRHRVWPHPALLLLLHLQEVSVQEEEEERWEKGAERCRGPQECPASGQLIQREGQC